MVKPAPFLQLTKLAFTVLLRRLKFEWYFQKPKCIHDEDENCLTYLPLLKASSITARETGDAAFYIRATVRIFCLHCLIFMSSSSNVHTYRLPAV